MSTSLANCFYFDVFLLACGVQGKRDSLTRKTWQEIFHHSPVN